MAGRKRNSMLSDRVIHERSRLLILTYLAGSEDPHVPFTVLQDALNLTAGNLSVQLKTLEKAEYVKIRKQFKDNKPLTTAMISAAGSQALAAYVDEMQNIIGQIGDARRDK